MQQYTEVITLKITITQKQTLAKLKLRNIKVSHFIRLAIKEKLDRDAKELVIKPKNICPITYRYLLCFLFSGFAYFY
jgi:hypothetical protein